MQFLWFFAKRLRSSQNDKQILRIITTPKLKKWKASWNVEIFPFNPLEHYHLLKQDMNGTQTTSQATTKPRIKKKSSVNLLIGLKKETRTIEILIFVITLSIAPLFFLQVQIFLKSVSVLGFIFTTRWKLFFRRKVFYWLCASIMLTYLNLLTKYLQWR